MAGVYDAIRVFAFEHRGCRELRYDAEPLTPEGYAVWVACGCGARLEQWVCRPMLRRICCDRRSWRSRTSRSRPRTRSLNPLGHRVAQPTCPR